MSFRVADNVFVRHQRAFLVVLLLPAMAITAALVLIFAFRPSRLISIALIMTVVLIQYLLFAGYVWKRALTLKKT
jgi:hypothetical protein